MLMCFAVAALLCLTVVPAAGIAMAEPVQENTAEEEKAAAPVSGSAVTLASKNVLNGGKWKKTKAGIRYLKKDGTYAADGWARIEDEVYFFTEEGYVKTGSFQWNSKCYYADSKGRLYISRKRKTSSGTYYYAKSGAMLKETWLLQERKYYYFNENGKLVKNRRIGNYYVNKSGVRVDEKWVSIGGKKYYYGKNGVLCRNRWVGSYYVGPDGARLTGINRKTLLSKSTGKKTETTSTEKKLIIIGASRVVHMQKEVGNNKKILYIAKSGQGYRWLVSTASIRLQAYLSIFPNSKVVIQLGNNDLHHRRYYFTMYKKLMNKYPKATFYFMDALPGNKKNTEKNEKRVAFNEALAAEFPKNYIGGYDYMMKSGFNTTKDGVHYTASTSRMIYRYILSKTGFKK